MKEISTYSRRGKSLEKIVNKANMKYRLEKKAIIYNIPLPVMMTGEGLIPKSAPTDYIGSIGPNGKAIAFDAKETKNATSFPLQNIHAHQLNFLTYFGYTGGISFFLIWFRESNEAYKTPVTFINDFIKNNKRKSIPKEEFKEEWKINLEDYLGLN